MTWLLDNPYELLYMEIELLFTLGLILFFVMRVGVTSEALFIPKNLAPCMTVPMALLLGIYLFLPPHVVPPTPPMLWPLPGQLKEKLEII